MAEGGAIVVLSIIAGLALVLAAMFATLWHRRRQDTFQAEAARFKSAAMIAERSRQAADVRAAFLSEILDALPNPIWRRADDLELIYANKAYAEAVGADTPAAALLDNMEIGGVETIDLARRAHRSNATLSEIHTIVVSGKRQRVETTERPLGGEELGGGLIGDARDITALAEADRIKNEFLYVISHELRTPLTTITGFADLLRADMAGDLYERQGEYLDDFLSACGAFIALIDDIIDLAAIETGRAPLERTPTSAADAVAKAANDAAELFAPQPLNIAPNVQCGLTLDADAERLCQIFKRLIMVAGRYAREGDPVVVTAKGEGDWAILTVTTEHIDLDEANTPFVLDSPDADVGFPRTRPARASLDLTLATRLAEAHGGEIVVNRAAPGTLSAYCRMPRLPDVV